MACPKCGCKTVYNYDAEDDVVDDRLQRCAACGAIFDLDDHADEDDGDDFEGRPRAPCRVIGKACRSVNLTGPSRGPSTGGNSNRIVGLLRTPPKGVM